MSPKHDAGAALASLERLETGKVGTTSWKKINQREEDLFAALIEDFDPMHNEKEWGATVGLGGPVVLGVHVLSMLPAFMQEHGLPAVAPGVEWRPLKLGRVRIPVSLPVGRRFREHMEILSVARGHGQSTILTSAHLVEVEDFEKPFLRIDEFVSSFSAMA